MEKQLTVSGIESKDGRIMLLEDVGKQYPVRYSFFQTWEGNNTNVYEQFLELSVCIGKTYTVEIQERKGKNAGGKEVTYRNIVNFYDSSLSQSSPNITKSSTSVPTVPVGDLPTWDDLNAVIARIDAMAQWAAGVATKEDLVNLENKFRTLLVDLRGEEAVELHTSMEAPKKFQFDLDKVKKQLTPDQLDIKVPNGL